MEERLPAEVQSLVPPRVRASQEAYWQCQNCQRLYWQDSHWQAMCRQIRALCPEGAPIPGSGFLPPPNQVPAPCVFGA